MKIGIYLWLTILISNFSANAQSTKCEKISDSIINKTIDSCLLKLYPDPDEEILRDGRNYRYQSFNLPIPDIFDTIKVFNFWENSTHRPSLMLFTIVSSSKIKYQFLLCNQSIDLDLSVIKSIFYFYPQIVEKYKLKFLEIWLEAREGILNTRCYLY